MAELFYFNPLDSFCRSTRGAVEQNTKIDFRVKLLRTRLVSVNLVLIYDKSGETRTIPMQWVELKSGYDIYECEFNPGEYKGLIWYYFEVVNCSGNTVYYGENSSNEAMSADLPAAFQLTVFDSKIHTPDWYCKGVTYHVFVDRFFRASSCEKLTYDPDFSVHTDTNDIPEYLPDSKGEILNRDIYGGNLKGIEEKLDYLDSLGVTTLYLSPIFEAWSNHKYNTADYMKIDSHFGDEKALKSLCKEAKKRGMRVILDGVFNHTGSDSVYFNQNGRYDSLGAYQSENSPYRSWYTFDSSPVGYQSWWGIRTLPSVNEGEDSYQNFIMGDNDSVAEHWLNAGISGWRLDVADELPDDFLIRFHQKVRSCNDEAIVIGEVWEDASNKIAYSVRRSYFTEPELDGVMNYPVKEGILNFLTNRISSQDFKITIERLYDHYPKDVHRCLMNLIGTHDTMRALNALSCSHLAGQSRDFKAHFKMDDNLRSYARQKLKMAACLQFMFPGSPSIYYGDETAMEGFEDPFNRRYYPWDNQDNDMIDHYKKLGTLKKNSHCMHNGMFKVSTSGEDCICILRESEKNAVFCAINRSELPCEVTLPFDGNWHEIFTQTTYICNDDDEYADVSSMSFNIWICEKTK